MTADQVTRKQLLELLEGKGAHMSFEEAIAGFPERLRNAKAPNLPYSMWHILEHLRIAQWDILEYVRNPDHKAPEWPKGYWPEPDAQADDAAWQQTIDQFRADLQAMMNIVKDPATDFYAALPHGYAGHTIFREVLVLADHNAYHVGEFAVLKTVLGA